MANDNKNVIIAYFPSVQDAETASNELKSWDKANDDIKLGGIGILKLEDGQIKTHSVGARASGTGATVGTFVGIVTGILSGGVTLVGGALVGLAGGAAIGGLKHKNLGLTDADIDTMKQELTDGKAALVVTADDPEVPRTLKEIERVGGKVMSYTMDRDAQDAINLAAFEADKDRYRNDAIMRGMPY